MNVPEFAEITYRRERPFVPPGQSGYSMRTVLATDLRRQFDPAMLLARVVENDHDGRGWHETGETLRLGMHLIAEVVPLIETRTGFLRRPKVDPAAPQTLAYEVTLGGNVEPGAVITVVFTESDARASFIVTNVENDDGRRRVTMMPDPTSPAAAAH